MNADGSESIPLRALAERDRWLCRICLEPVTPGAEPPHPEAPTRDHVVPLAKGGRHTWDNVQLAHYRCNELKRDETADGQG